MKFISRSAVFAFAAVLVMAPGLSLAWEQDRTYAVTVLHTNDHHGRFWQNEHGEYGLAAQKTLIDRIRKEVAAEGGSVLLLSAGDVNTGVPESDLQDAKPDFLGMRLIGYDAMALGNHEFDNPMEVLRRQEQWASFPFLSANIYDKNSGKRLFQPYQTFERQGLRIAVLGLTTADTAKIGNPEYLGATEFRDPVAEAKTELARLRAEEKPDVVVALTHMGHYDNGAHGSNAPGDVTLARAVPTGALDAIIGGHSQDSVCMAEENKKQAAYAAGSPCMPDRQNGVWIMQAHEWGKFVGRADFTFRNGVLTLQNYQLIPVNLNRREKQADGAVKRTYFAEAIPQDAAMLELLEPFQKKGEAALAVKIGRVEGRLEGDRSKARFEQTNMGRLLLAAQIERTQADLGVMSGGGVRDSIDEGDVSYKDVLKVQPFGNTVAYVDLSGAELEKYLGVVANKKPNSGAYAQFANVSLTADGKDGVKGVKIKGKPLEAKKIYRLALPSFNAVGGDGYPDVSRHPGYVNTGFVDAEVLKDYIERHAPIDARAYQPKGEILYR